MFKSQRTVLVAAAIIYIAYLYGFSCVFDLDYTLIFYILAGMMGMEFYAFASDYYPKTEADKMQDPSPGLRYIEDNSYTWASLTAILMLLLSITPLLITIYLNQSDTYRVLWIFQGLIFLAGYAIQAITLAIYKYFDSISVSGSIWYDRVAQRARTSPVTMDDVMKTIDETNDILTRRKISEATYAEADKIVREILRDLMGLNDYEITDSAKLDSDLGVDFFDIVDIEVEIEKRICKKYGFSIWNLKHYYQESDIVQMYIDVRDSAILDDLDFSKIEDVDSYGEELICVLQTVKDCKELVAGFIHYVRYIKQH